MAYIEFGPGLPGIRGALAFSPATAKPLCELVEVLLHGPHTLTPAEREMIATYVSAQNDCHYCQSCHGATAAEHLGGRPSDYELVSQVKRNYTVAPVSDKMKALLAIAGEVQKGGKYVTPDDVAAARRQGATDKEIHDTAHRCSLLHVQSIRGRSRNLAATRSRSLSRDWKANVTAGLCGPGLETTTPDSGQQIAPNNGAFLWRAFDCPKAFPASRANGLQA